MIVFHANGDERQARSLFFGYKINELRFVNFGHRIPVKEDFVAYVTDISFPDERETVNFFRRLSKAKTKIAVMISASNPRVGFWVGRCSKEMPLSVFFDTESLMKYLCLESKEMVPLREVRHMYGFTQTELGILLGVTLRTIQNWEQGIGNGKKVVQKTKVLRDICEAVERIYGKENFSTWLSSRPTGLHGRTNIEVIQMEHTSEVLDILMKKA